MNEMNPVKSHMVADGIVSAECAVAHDAWATGSALAPQLTIGLPATVGGRNDRYAGKVVHATRAMIVVEAGCCTYRFRLTKRGWRTPAGHFLSVGIADEYRSPEV